MRGPRPVRALVALTAAWIGATDALAQRRSASPAPAAPPPLAADDAALDRQVRAIASSLRCPVCYGLSVADSPSDIARDMKQVIRDMLVAGASPDEVRAYFVTRYGEWILLKPEPRGFNLVVWLLPIATLVVGSGVIWIAVRRWTRREPAG